MKYLATIKRYYDSMSKMFRTSTEAEQWIDENNNNHESTSYIEEFDDQWNKIGSYVYTEAKE